MNVNAPGGPGRRWPSTQQANETAAGPSVSPRVDTAASPSKGPSPRGLREPPHLSARDRALVGTGGSQAGTYFPGDAARIAALWGVPSVTRSPTALPLPDGVAVSSKAKQEEPLVDVGVLDTADAALTWLEQSPKYWAHVADALKGNPDFVFRAIKKAPGIFEFLPAPQRADADLALTAARADDMQAAFIEPSLFDDPAFVERLVQDVPDAFTCLPAAQQMDKRLLELALRSGPSSFLAYTLPERITSDLDRMRLVVAHDPAAWSLASPELKQDKSLALESVSRDAQVACGLPSSLAEDPEILDGTREAIVAGRTRAFVFTDLPAALQSDMAVAEGFLKAVPDGWSSVPSAMLEHPALRPALLDALRRATVLPEGGSLALPPSLRSAPEALAYVLENSTHWDALPADLKNDSFLAARAVRRRPGMYQHLPGELRANRDVVLAYVRDARGGSAYANNGYVGPADVDGPTPPLLADVPERFRDDDEVVFHAVLRSPQSLPLASQRLRGDRRIVLAACYQDGALLEHASPALKRDREVVEVAVREKATAMEFADESLRRDPALARTAITGWANAFTYIPRDTPGYLGLAALARTSQPANEELLQNAPLWNRDPEAVLALAQRRVLSPYQIVPALDRELLADRTFVRRLVSAAGETISLLPSPLREDPELITAALRANPDLAGAYLEFLKERPALARELVEADPSILHSVEWMRSDRQLAFTALVFRAGLIRVLDPALLEDEAFLRDCVMANPLIADELSPQRIRGLFAAYPEVERSVTAVRSQLKALDIDFPERFGGDGVLLKEIIANRTEAGQSDPRPVAVMIYPKEDWNRAFEQTSARELSKHHRVMYIEVDSDEGMVEALRAATEFKPASLVEIGGHGSQVATAFGAGDPAREASGNHGGTAYLDLGDASWLAAAGLRDRIVPGGNVILKSCSTGEGQRVEDNVANLLARVLPHVNVYASRVPRPVQQQDRARRSRAFRRTGLPGRNPDVRHPGAVRRPRPRDLLAKPATWTNAAGPSIRRRCHPQSARTSRSTPAAGQASREATSPGSAATPTTADAPPAKAARRTTPKSRGPPRPTQPSCSEAVVEVV